MKRFLLLFGFTFVILTTMGQPIHLTAGDLSVTIDKYGYYSSLKVCGQELLQSKELYPVVSAYDEQLRTPQSVRFHHDTLTCLMNDDKEVLLRITRLPQCLTMEVIACPQYYKSLTFGPVAVNIDEVVGEVVGVAQGGNVAFGMQVLNVKTTGGIPYEAANACSEKFFYQGHHVDGRPGYSLAATRIEGGTVFQLSGRYRGKWYNRQEVRAIGNCHDAIADPVLGEEGLIVGAKVAMFGCPRAKVLEHIGLMETTLDLPHPMTVDDIWVKMPQKKTAQQKAPKKDILSYNVMNVVPWDHPMVTTTLSSHFHQQLMFQLEENLDATDTTISILTGAFNCFPYLMEGKQVVRLEEELISYRVAEDNDGHVTLRGCRRGAFGTVAGPHNKFTMGSRLWTVKEGFVPDMELLDTLADRAVEGLSRHSVLTIPTEIIFDHLDYCALTGQDEYAVARFVSRCCEKWTRPVIILADYATNYTWHYLSGLTDRRGLDYPDVTDTTWRFIHVVPPHNHAAHEHAHGEGEHDHDHAHSEGEHEHDHVHGEVGHTHDHDHGEVEHEHDHAHSEVEHEHDHAHSEVEHDHDHESHSVTSQKPKNQQPIVKEETTIEDFLTRNLLQ